MKTHRNLYISYACKDDSHVHTYGAPEGSCEIHIYIILLRSLEILMRSLTIILRSLEILLRSHEILLRSNEIFTIFSSLEISISFLRNSI